MNGEQFVARLDGVKPTRRGWVGKCKAHDDKHPSLSITEGERGLLVKCWAGCTLEEITRALGLTVRDLFYDTNPDPRALKEAQQRRERKRQRDARQRRVDGLACDTLREADNLIRQARDIDISTWSHTRLDCELNRLADAYALLAGERDGH